MSQTETREHIMSMPMEDFENLCIAATSNTSTELIEQIKGEIKPPVEQPTALNTKFTSSLSSLSNQANPSTSSSQYSGGGGPGSTMGSVGEVDDSGRDQILSNHSDNPPPGGNYGYDLPRKYYFNTRDDEGKSVKGGVCKYGIGGESTHSSVFRKRSEMGDYEWVKYDSLNGNLHSETDDYDKMRLPRPDSATSPGDTPSSSSKESNNSSPPDLNVPLGGGGSGTKGSSEGSSFTLKSNPAESNQNSLASKSQKKSQKNAKLQNRTKDIVVEKIDGYRGELSTPIDALVEFVEGKNGGMSKRSLGRKESSGREQRSKSSEKELLVKSVSLDDDNFTGMAGRPLSERTSAGGSVREIGKRLSQSSSTTPTSSSLPEGATPPPSSHPTHVNKREIYSQPKEHDEMPSYTPPILSRPPPPTPPSKKPINSYLGHQNAQNTVDTVDSSSSAEIVKPCTTAPPPSADAMDSSEFRTVTRKNKFKNKNKGDLGHGGGGNSAVVVSGANNNHTSNRERDHFVVGSTSKMTPPPPPSSSSSSSHNPHPISHQHLPPRPHSTNSSPDIEQYPPLGGLAPPPLPRPSTIQTRNWVNVCSGGSKVAPPPGSGAKPASPPSQSPSPLITSSLSECTVGFLGATTREELVVEFGGDGGGALTEGGGGGGAAIQESGVGEEAVVFCGENFRGAPPSNPLDIEFGYNVPIRGALDSCNSTETTSEQQLGYNNKYSVGWITFGPGLPKIDAFFVGSCPPPSSSTSKDFDHIACQKYMDDYCSRRCGDGSIVVHRI